LLSDRCQGIDGNADSHFNDADLIRVLYGTEILFGDQMKGDEMCGHVARIGEMRNAYSISVLKPEGKRPPRRPRWEDNIRMDFREIRWESVNWIHLAHDRNQ
jgi:hypothetical protein